MSERIDELIGVIVSWEGWFDWNEAQREVLKDVILNLEKARRVDYLEKEYEVRRVCYLEEHINRLEKENKRYRDLLKEIKSDIKTDYTDSEIENMPLLNVIIEQINKALEGDSDE